jgi:predicted MPP superfamily phosphohydrolase
MLRTRWPYKIDFPALRQASRPQPLAIKPRVQFRLPAGFHYHRYPIELPNLPAALVGLRILHLTDTHLRSYWGPPYDRLLERVTAGPPDLILFTGDFIDNKCDHRPALPTVQRLVRGLVAVAPTCAILGNHDPEVLQPYVAELGVPFLTHRRVLFPIRGHHLELIGLPGTARQELDMDFVRSVPEPVAGTPRIILCHYPDLFPATLHLTPDLYLTGHTHGGQICLPNGNALISHDRMPKRFAKGLHRIGGAWYHASNGFGVTGLPFRFFCPPETTEFHLKHKI